MSTHSVLFAKTASLTFHPVEIANATRRLADHRLPEHPNPLTPLPIGWKLRALMLMLRTKAAVGNLVTH